MNAYIGHDSQLYGVEEHRLVGGRGDGMHLFEIHNGKGLDLTTSPDRNGDITRLRYRGINMSYMCPNGYVAPAYYDSIGTNWLNSFTAGYLTTCGLNNVGNPNTDDGEELPLHGSISNTPAEHAYWTEEKTENGTFLVIRTTTRDETVFGRKLRLEREVRVSVDENFFEIHDAITNTGDRREPFEILYHMNMGYPLLDEDSVITIPSDSVKPRNAHASEGLADWMHMQPPTPGYEEMCYYHTFSDGNGLAKIYQPKLKTALTITFNAKELDGFVEWKMMGVRDYVLGLECGNCYPDGRDVMRETGMLKFLEPGQIQKYRVHVALTTE